MASDPATIKRWVGPALARVVEPGDRVVAGTMASPLVRLMIATLSGLLLPLALFITYLATHENGAVIVPLIVAGIAVNAAAQYQRRLFFIAVTERQLICQGLFWFTGKPTRLKFTAPLHAVQVTTGGRTPLGRQLGIQYSQPGREPRDLRLSIPGQWSGDLDEVLAALRAGGASVTASARSERT